MSENLREERKKVKSEKKRPESTKETRIEREINFYAKASEIKRAMFLKRPMIVLLHKAVFLNTNEIDFALPSSVVSLLQEYEDVFPKETPLGFHLFEGLNI